MPFLLLFLLAAFVPQAAGQEQTTAGQNREEQETKPPKRGDAVIARGCLRGSVLENATLDSPDFTGVFTYRLTGDKKTIEKIRKEHDGHMDVITGKLKTDLPWSPDQGKKIGNTRVVIGAAPRPMAQESPSMPVIEVASFEHTDMSCR